MSDKVDTAGKSGWEKWLPWIMALGGAATTAYTAKKGAESQREAAKQNNQPQWQTQTQLPFASNISSALLIPLMQEALGRYSSLPGRPQGGQFTSPEYINQLFSQLTGGGTRAATPNDFLYGFNTPQGKA